MDWILERLPVVIFIIVFIAQVVRGFLRTREENAEAPPRKHDSLEEQRRAREVQAEIRRRILERRAGKQVQEPASRRVEPPAPPVIIRRDPTAIPDPFGGPVRKMIEEFERRLNPQAEPPPILREDVERRTAEVARQERLAEEMRNLEEARAQAQRRARQIAEASIFEERTVKAQRNAARGRLLDDLRNPESLKRAVVLREVLGTPVGLR